MEIPAQYLQPGELMDADHPDVIAFSQQFAKGESALEKAVSLYYHIRDSFLYDPYQLDLRASKMKASYFITQQRGYCIEKANLLGACARVQGIPSRLGFANVRNHIGTEKFVEYLGTDIMVFHGYTDLYLDGKWVKATPAFNIELCKKLNVAPLEFDGTQDSIFQEFDQEGGRYMDYVHDYGTFAEWPRTLFIEELKKYYPRIFGQDGKLKSNQPFLS